MTTVTALTTETGIKIYIWIESDDYNYYIEYNYYIDYNNNND